MSDIREQILDAIRKEREYQEARWGDADDAQNLPNDFVGYISHYSTRWMKGEIHPYTMDNMVRFHDSMVEAAAIAVAAAEYSAKIINGDLERPDVLLKD